MTGIMQPLELRAVREFLGLTPEALADWLGVSDRTVRHWEAGRYPIPDGVRLEVEGLETYTGDAIGQLVSALNDAPDPAVRLYADDGELREASPDLPGWVTARWWRHVVMRACLEVPGVELI